MTSQDAVPHFGDGRAFSFDGSSGVQRHLGESKMTCAAGGRWHGPTGGHDHDAWPHFHDALEAFAYAQDILVDYISGYGCYRRRRP